MTDLADSIVKNPRWPLAPLCHCGGGPWPFRSSHCLAVEEGGVVDVEDCPRWREIAVNCGWWAPEWPDLLNC